MTQKQERRRIRAMRLDEPDAQIVARAAALRPFIGRTGDERVTALRRLLRQERRASLIGGGYDACRHAALTRLLAEALAGASPARHENGRRE
ncbi:hypothetical protein [Ancylobacter radicis]|uniref:Uncharacterized protein n=1 Tax=Ancylobacter radicis TaxID=2836179 RepID=A0ABS5RBW9_9HYPH|nr:hypothetical protein [Ancylobacter radicis]MBS9478805.1 hypothetical protein [Ancylobacter radicis]